MSGFVVDFDHIDSMIRFVEDVKRRVHREVTGPLESDHWNALENLERGIDPFGHFNHAGVVHRSVKESRQSLIGDVRGLEARLESMVRGLKTMADTYHNVDELNRASMAGQDAAIAGLFPAAGDGSETPGAGVPGVV